MARLIQLSQNVWLGPSGFWVLLWFSRALWILCWQQQHWSLLFLSRQFFVGLLDLDCYVAFTGQIERNFLCWCHVSFSPAPTLHMLNCYKALILLFCYYDGIAVLYICIYMYHLLVVWEPSCL